MPVRRMNVSWTFSRATEHTPSHRHRLLSYVDCELKTCGVMTSMCSTVGLESSTLE